MTFLAFLIPCLIFAGTLAWIDRRLARLPRENALALLTVIREERSAGMDGVAQAVAVRVSAVVDEFASRKEALDRAHRIELASAESRARKAERALADLLGLLERAEAVRPALASHLKPALPPTIPPSAPPPPADDACEDTLDDEAEETRVRPFPRRVTAILPVAPEPAPEPRGAA